ncbi:unnamed protein product [Mytilus edulis]|nr:unnamed protein product [Mytilus edulis]
MDDTDSADYGNDLHSDRDDSAYSMPPSAMGQYRKDVELPTFEDPIVRRALEDNKPPSRHMWSKIITRCAYHLLSKGVPRKHDYQAFAESFFRRYPCVGTSRGPNPWTSFTKSVSQKVRTLRYISKRRYSHQKLKIKP